MRIGLDFDNTIVSYDALFHTVAVEQGVLPIGIPVDKIAVRDYLRRVGKEPIWTEIQGYVYGVRMDEAKIYPGVIDFLVRATRSGHALSIISHKTRYPFLGPQYNLHDAAYAWINHHLTTNEIPLIEQSRVFFEVTEEDKFARIAAFGCDIFVDDLPEILLSKQFPVSTQGILFDPKSHHKVPSNRIVSCSTWGEIEAALLL